MQIMLVCWHCNSTLFTYSDSIPRLGFYLADIANKLGWYGVIDSNRNRELVFCCKEHAEAEKTKKGVFRAMPLGVKPNVKCNAKDTFRADQISETTHENNR